jgi:hypothetical protein
MPRAVSRTVSWDILSRPFGTPVADGCLNGKTYLRAGRPIGLEDGCPG